MHVQYEMIQCSSFREEVISVYLMIGNPPLDELFLIIVVQLLIFKWITQNPL